MISFVVPAYNEAQHLRQTLEAILAAAESSGEQYEIVVADDASTDDTAAIALTTGARVVRVAHRHIAATRNAGARAATGDVLIFVDADTRIPPDTISQVRHALATGAIGGGAVVRFDGPVAWHFRLLTRVTVLGSRLTRLAFGCFIFCTRTAFVDTGGFDETIYASEEIAFSRALKRYGRFVILPAEVLTSGRKLRAHSASEVWRALGHAMLQMVGLKRGRRGLDAWYGGRREDPWRLS